MLNFGSFVFQPHSASVEFSLLPLTFLSLLPLLLPTPERTTNSAITTDGRFLNPASLEGYSMGKPEANWRQAKWFTSTTSMTIR